MYSILQKYIAGTVWIRLRKRGDNAAQDRTETRKEAVLPL
ncbi:MAG: hypothetical protein J07HN6_00982 [Halonotius sp. J07HN6]|nr:MAG: hypothetical protein J07HN6_00982 [Halonotius sp. J07HN6]